MEANLLRGKNAIVTGANQGIGEAIAHKLAAHGASLFLVDIDEHIEIVAKDIADTYNVQVHHFKGDLSKEHIIQNVVNDVKQHFNEINILVNNAGIMQTKPFMEVTADDWDLVLNVNLKSVFMLSQQVINEMLLQQTKGTIVNMSSIAGRSGRPLAPHYAASKAGVISLTKSMAEAFGKQNIRTNAVCPGVIMTPLMEQIYEDRKLVGDSNNVEKKFLERIKLDRLGTPVDVAKAVLFLCSDLSDYINGQAINVCGGYEMN